MFNQQFYPGYMPNYNPQMPQVPSVSQTPQAQSVPQGQTIQTIDKSLDSQAFNYFVKSADEMKSIKVLPGFYYIGINIADNEMYLRKINDDGVIATSKYILASDSCEKNVNELILERLENIESRLPINNDKSSWRKGDK